jgi:arabinogalactan endo-1,4-beta-galactosidase
MLFFAAMVSFSVQAEKNPVDLFASVKNQGFNAVRLRVWVNPQNYSAKLYSAKDDVVAKSARAAEQGLDVMIDFHYCDFFADPGRQTKPSDWKDLSRDELLDAIASHTKEILSAVKETGANVKWVQIGNEVSAGMLWDKDASKSGATWSGKINGETFNAKSDAFANFAEFINAGSDAAKEIFPDAKVIVHTDSAYDLEKQKWIFGGLQAKKCRFDIIGLSHYPQDNPQKNYKKMNSSAVATVKFLAKTYKKDIFICEVGTKSATKSAPDAMKEFVDQAKEISAIKGIFYWEPQVYGNWKPAYYKKLNWNAYDMGAYTSAGKPSEVLGFLTSSGIETVGADISWVTEMEDDGVKFYE